MKTIVCYGDSNTWGYMPKVEIPEVEALNRYPWGVRWTSLLQMKLGSDYRVEEEGLNGRTTAFDCLMEDHRNGLKDIDVCMMTHTPVDLVVLMLGTNDTKNVLHLTPHVVAHGIERLIERIRTGGHGRDGGMPEILLVTPIRMREGVENAWLGDEFDQTSLKMDSLLPAYFEKTAAAAGVHFLNVSASVTADPADCIHMNEEGHAKVAEMIYEKVREILE